MRVRETGRGRRDREKGQRAREVGGREGGRKSGRD